LTLYLTENKQSIDEIWLAFPLSSEKRVKELLHILRHQMITIRFVMDMFGLEMRTHSMTQLLGFPSLNLNMTPMVGGSRLIKAIEDRVLSALILILISPLLLGIAIGVKCTSRGPIFFKQLRHGWDGRIITIYKFRTMFEHQEEAGRVSQAKLDDPRVTPFGRLLRKMSLDELPQFINVLQGRMSIVGPRPHAVSHNEFYKDSIKAYMQRHKVKPGITGWAQVNGWRGETDTLEKMEKRVEYDLYYIENWSLGLDIKIIFLTILKGLINKNAY
jgi:putative colanic acid biosynthesis UDP-glucose lipid carrier transferase